MTRHIDTDAVADADIDRHFDYLAERSVEVGLRFLRAVTQSLEDLALMPGIGARRDYHNPDLVGLRMSPVTRFENYLIFYLTTEDSIHVVRVLHGAQDIERIFQSKTGK